MSKEERRVPELRFKGFFEDWEQHKLEDIAHISKGKSYSKNDLTDNGHQIILYGQMYTNYQTEINGTNTFVNPKPNSVYSEGTEVIVPASGETSEDISIASAITSNNIIIGGDLNIILPRNFINNTFLALTMSYGNSKKKLSKFAQGKTIVHLHGTNFRKLSIYLPIFDEQIKIKKLITNIEKNINLHQRKIEKMNSLNKVLLKSIYTRDNNEVPNIKYKNFDDQWSKKKLSQITERITRKNVKLEAKLPLTISAVDGLVDQETYFKKQVASKNLQGYYLMKNGEFAYNKSYSFSYPYGAVKRLDKYPEGALSTLYILFNPTGVNSNFLLHYYETNNWHREVSKRAAEGARNHGLLNISAKDFFETELFIPNSDEEQKYIGKLFNQTSKIIELHRNKIEKLNDIKKSYLQKMFL